jgi:N-carbamoylputrescine amidase
MPEIGLIQMRCSLDPSEILESGIALIREAAARGAQIICLPELFKTVYFCQEENHKYFQYAEPIPGPTTERLSALAKELQVVIVASLFEKRAAGLYHNTAAVIDADGTLLGIYRKMHIPRWGVGVLGPMVSGSSPTHRFTRRRSYLLSNCDWLAPVREIGVR